MAEDEKNKNLDNNLKSGSKSMDYISKLKYDVNVAKFLGTFSQGKSLEIKKKKKEIARKLTLERKCKI